MSASSLFMMVCTIALFVPVFSLSDGLVSTANAETKSSIYELKKVVEYVPAPQAKLSGVPTTSTWETKSTSGSTSTYVIFENRSSRTVTVYWINYSGKEVQYRTLPPGSMYRQQTYETHPWVIRDGASSKFISMFVAKEQELLYSVY